MCASTIVYINHCHDDCNHIVSQYTALPCRVPKPATLHWIGNHLISALIGHSLGILSGETPHWTALYAIVPYCLITVNSGIADLQVAALLHDKGARQVKADVVCQCQMACGILS
jgi:hypothetical protein